MAVFVATNAAVRLSLRSVKVVQRPFRAMPVASGTVIVLRHTAHGIQSSLVILHSPEPGLEPGGTRLASLVKLGRVGSGSTPGYNTMGRLMLAAGCVRSSSKTGLRPVNCHGRFNVNGTNSWVNASWVTGWVQRSGTGQLFGCMPERL